MSAAPVKGSSAARAGCTRRTVGGGASGAGGFGRRFGVRVGGRVGGRDIGGFSATPPRTQLAPALVMTHRSPQRRPELVSAQDGVPGAHGAPPLVTMHVVPSTQTPPALVTKHALPGAQVSAPLEMTQPGGTVTVKPPIVTVTGPLVGAGV